MTNHELNQAPLGKKSAYIAHYQRDLLFPIPRKNNRDNIGVKSSLPFHGHDIWNAYELSWLNAKGKPVVASAVFTLSCASPNIIESKSFKLYLNSLTNTAFDSFAAVESILIRDLSEAAGAPFAVKLFSLSQVTEKIVRHFSGVGIDDLDVACDTYSIEPTYLICDNQTVTETLHSDLLKANCLVTGQPDWGSVQIAYTGKKIQREGLLKYIISFRNTNEFAEPCTERIFMDISKQCQPEKLLVYARFTRRGGLDINPYRANYPVTVDNERLSRQ